MDIDCLSDGEGPAVVLVHGGASSNRQWKSLILQLRENFRVLAPNMHGAGATPAWQADRPYRLTDAADLIAEVCAGAPGEVNLVGHSVGGAWAMQAAAQLGTRVRRLVLLEAAPYDLLRQAGLDGPYREALTLYDIVRTGSEKNEWRAIAEKFLDVFVGPGTWAAMPEERRRRAAELMRQNRAEWDSLMLDRTSIKQWQASLPRSTLLLSAADTWPPLRALMELFARLFPHWRHVVLPEGGHMAPLYRPEAVNRQIEAFLNS